LKVELSVATMILIVQKAGIKKNTKNQDSKNEFISRKAEEIPSAVFIILFKNSIRSVIKKSTR
ncbi:MAG: hypothetical protein JWQ40_3129, partial [Segetibacter sp.]|nr:hypothetical protein [Segetibacter sp.]